ncbi:short chain dehydrogenase [Marinicella pacifica]|uniref:Short chain dehydrogenase n=1 Tax=Marinicella pacifica TaxID=1171543 RepID=A0A917CLV4_9GAMM|nr:SDR family oxidoreductase [Marinicella pacifica]GGF91570.1 short chain dehydrogenase [Marinicella pacifica]
MSYFVTGGSGFIGRFLLPKLFARKGDIYLLVRKGSVNKLKQQLKDMDAPLKRIELVIGDLTKDNLGLSKKQQQELNAKVKHFFHLAAVYDMAADLEAQLNTNVDGTRHAMNLAETIKAGCFHHISSIAVAGLYPGVFREDMFEEAEGLEHPYFRTKHDAEKAVRNHCQVPYRIYRPAMVLGHSKTGEIDKIDGPYYFFKLIQKLRKAFPQWMPMMGIEGGRLNMVPVDYVVDVIDHIAHKKGLDGGCFHITDPKPKRIGHVLNIFADAAHAPQMNMRIDARVFNFIPGAVKQGLMMLSPVKRIRQQIMNDLGIPPGVLNFVNYPTRFDDRETQKALKGSAIKLPKLKNYAWTLWDYWERHLDPDLFIDRSLSGRVKEKRVMITGATSGIGLATAQMLAEAGAELIIVARKQAALDETAQDLKQLGARAVHRYSADIANEKAANQLVADVIEDLGGVDILINNAGRSIRRSIALSYDRFHDFERTMDLNYFGSLRLIMGFLPGMAERCLGHVINISSIGVLTNAPRFSAYVASKAALDAFARCAAAEYNDVNVAFTTINMPLVRTPMIAPTKIYNSVPTISPEEAAEFIKDAIIRRPQRIATRLGVFAQVMHALAPKSMEVVMNTAFNMFPDSAAAKGEQSSGTREPSPEQMAFASLMRGVHW